jgi:hypothetical protein
MNKGFFKLNKWLVTGIIGFLVVVVIGVGFYIRTANADGAQEAKIQYTSIQAGGELYKQIEVGTSEDGYLAEEITKEQVSQFSAQLESQLASLETYNEKYPENKFNLSIADNLHTMITNLENKLITEDELKELISYSDYLSDANPKNEEVVITDEVTSKTLTNFTENIRLREFPDDKWSEKIQFLSDEMDKQLKQIELASQAVNALFEDEKVKENSTSKEYEAAVKEVEKILRKTDKEALLKRLEKVKKYLAELNKTEETIETEEETYLLNSLDEAREYLAERMPQAGGPQQFVNGQVTNQGYYSFDYQLYGDDEGVVWNRIIIDRNKNTISDDFLKRVSRDEMDDTFDHYQENTGGTVTQSEAIEKAGAFHHSLGRASATLLDTSGTAGGYTVEYIEGERYIYVYFVSDDGSVYDQGVFEIYIDEYEEPNDYETYEEFDYYEDYEDFDE